MECFQVRCDPIVVIYERKLFIRLATAVSLGVNIVPFTPYNSLFMVGKQITIVGRSLANPIKLYSLNYS